MSATVSFLLPVPSPAEQDDSGALPSTMFTIWMRSLTVTSPSPVQLPTHVLSVTVGVLGAGG